MEPESARIRSYLVGQARKLTVPELVDKLRRDSGALREAAAAVPAGRFAERADPDEWSAAEVFAHLLDTTESSAVAIGAILDGQGIPARLRDEISGETRAGLATAEDHWLAFVDLREPFYARLLQARGDEHLDVVMAHPLFGDLNWREWLLFLRVHDLLHARQIQAVAERLGR